MNNDLIMNKSIQVTALDLNTYQVKPQIWKCNTLREVLSLLEPKKVVVETKAKKDKLKVFVTWGINAKNFVEMEVINV